MTHSFSLLAKDVTHLKYYFKTTTVPKNIILFFKSKYVTCLKEFNQDEKEDTFLAATDNSKLAEILIQRKEFVLYHTHLTIYILDPQQKEKR